MPVLGIFLFLSSSVDEDRLGYDRKLKGKELILALDDENWVRAEKLLEEGADPNIKAPTGSGWHRMTPLELAIRHRNPEMVRLILEAGANPNERGEEKYYDYILDAVNRHNIEIVKLLVQGGAKIQRETVLYAYGKESYFIHSYLEKEYKNNESRKQRIFLSCFTMGMIVCGLPAARILYQRDRRFRSLVTGFPSFSRQMGRFPGRILAWRPFSGQPLSSRSIVSEPTPTSVPQVTVEERAERPKSIPQAKPESLRPLLLEEPFSRETFKRDVWRELLLGNASALAELCQSIPRAEIHSLLPMNSCSISYDPVEFLAQCRDLRSRQKVEKFLVDRHPRSSEKVLRSRFSDTGSEVVRNLTEEAARGEFSRVFGREEDIQQVWNVLKQGQNPVVLGEAGVGKSAVVEEMAWQIVTGQSPQEFRDRDIWFVDLTKLLGVSNTWVGVLEKNLDGIISSAKACGAIVFFDEVHRIATAGSTMGNPSGIGENMKTTLGREGVSFIGATTTAEFDRHVFKPNPALARRFKRVCLGHLSGNALVQILQQVFSEGLEGSSREGLLTPSALHAAIELGRKYFPYQNSPAREIGIIRDAVSINGERKKTADKLGPLELALRDARANLHFYEQTPSIRWQARREGLRQQVSFLEKQMGDRAKTVQAPDATFQKEIEQLTQTLKNAIEHRNNLIEEPDSGRQDQFYKVAALEFIIIPSLKKKIISIADREQGGVADGYCITGNTVEKAIFMRKGIPPLLSLSNPKSVKNLLELESRLNERVIGQEGVTKALANAFIRFTTGVKTPKELVGSFLFLGSTGVGKTYATEVFAEEAFGSIDACVVYNMAEYQGLGSIQRLVGGLRLDDRGLLVERLRRRPYSVVVLDEFEKAHPLVQDLFLQVLDEGYFRDEQGKKIDCSRSLFVLTSNIGAEAILNGEDYLPHLQGHLRPEFINRLDQVIPFNPLSTEVVDRIVRLVLKQMAYEVMNSKQVELTFSEEVVKFIGEKGYDRLYGARPIKRCVKRCIRTPLAHYLLTHAAAKKMRVFLQGDKISFSQM